MNINGKYLKDENGQIISPIVSINTIYDENNKPLAIDSGLPVGSGCDYFGTTAPEGYLFADGSAISRTEYAELFEVLGTVYGAGDGSTTFNLPDKRSRVSVMLDSGTFNTLGKTGGAETHTLTVAQMPKHQHSLGNNGTYIANNDGTEKFHPGNGGGNFVIGCFYSNATTYSGSGSAHNNLQPYFVCNYIIKAKSTVANANVVILNALEGEY